MNCLCYFDTNLVISQGFTYYSISINLNEKISLVLRIKHYLIDLDSVIESDNRRRTDVGSGEQSLSGMR